MRSISGLSYNTPPRSRRAGFSLIEVLVTIGVIGILIAILVPVLFGAKAAGGQTVTLSNLRQLGLTMADYHATHREAYPFAPAGSSFQLGPPDAGMGAISPGYWDLSIYWPALLHDIAPWREHFATWVGPGGVEDDQRPWMRETEFGQTFRWPSYRLSHTMFARPELWAPATEDDQAFYRPVFVKDVRHPASKVVFWDAELTHLQSSPEADRDPRASLFADGHVSVHRLSEAATPPTISFKDTRPLQDTPDGVHGRDY